MRRAAVLFCLVLLTAAHCAAQQKQRAKSGHSRKRCISVEAPPPQIFRTVDQMAAFSGDVNAWLHGHLRYPDEARESNIEGRADVMFEIGTDGIVKVLSLVRSSGFQVLDNEARRVVGGMPAWKPAKVNGRLVKELKILPVVFKLE